MFAAFEQVTDEPRSQSPNAMQDPGEKELGKTRVIPQRANGIGFCQANENTVGQAHDRRHADIFAEQAGFAEEGVVFEGGHDGGFALRRHDLNPHLSRFEVVQAIGGIALCVDGDSGLGLGRRPAVRGREGLKINDFPDGR